MQSSTEVCGISTERRKYQQIRNLIKIFSNSTKIHFNTEDCTANVRYWDTHLDVQNTHQITLYNPKNYGNLIIEVRDGYYEIQHLINPKYWNIGRYWVNLENFILYVGHHLVGRILLQGTSPSFLCTTFGLQIPGIQDKEYWEEQIFVSNIECH